MYYELLNKLALLDRCHNGPEMQIAYNHLVGYFSGARIIRCSSGVEVNHWRLPPYWKCTHAELSDEFGNIIASRSHHNLSVFSYSPSIEETMTLSELQEHLFSDPSRPEATCFHFRNQYRHWEPEWGFSIPHKVRQNLSDKVNYRINIESEFDSSREMIQSDYHHQGELDDTYLFVGHFDHPSQVNDGLAGCIAAYEIIRRLRGRDTRYSYRAFASVEIVGSVYYLDSLGEDAKKIKESLFLGFSGIESPLIYQQTYQKKSLIDRITKFLFSFRESKGDSIFNHRELVGNDENAFDSVGYEIPSGTLLRWPFQQYHTDHDSMEITSKESLEEVINFGLRVVDIIENNLYIKAKYKGLPSLANPEVDLYLSIDMVSGVDTSDTRDLGQYQCELPQHEYQYMQENSHLLNQFMQNMVRLSDGRHTILDVAEISKIPFEFVLKYADLMREKGLVSLEVTSQ